MRRTTARPSSTCARSDCTAIAVSADRKSLHLVAGLDSSSRRCIRARPRASTTLKIASQTLFDGAAPPQLDAYYTLRRFPAGAARR